MIPRSPIKIVQLNLKIRILKICSYQLHFYFSQSINSKYCV